MEYTIGDLAKRSGLTVRALHHYEKLGLLQPSGRTQAGYRLYSTADVQTLHRILAYRQMGVPLKQIAPLIGPDAPPLAQVVAEQRAAIELQVARQQQVLAMLRRVEKRLDEGGDELAGEMLQAMSMVQLYERHFSAAELDRMRAMQAQLGPETLKSLKAEIAGLLADWRAAFARGAATNAPEVTALAQRWLALGQRFPQDEALRERANAMLKQEPAMREAMGLSADELKFMNRAMEAVQ
jgi:DNA-binding transcriptional MerR regulator